jgi:hypothetical protein
MAKNKTYHIFVWVGASLLILLLVLSFVFFYMYPITTNITTNISNTSALTFSDAILTYVPGSKKTGVQSIASGDIVVLDRNSIYVRLYVANITDLIMAHIHILDPSNNNPPILTLFSRPDKPITIGDTPILIVNGLFSSRSFINDLKGKDVSFFLEKIAQKKLFFNVHTVLNPNGELQGTINLLTLDVITTSK